MVETNVTPQLRKIAQKRKNEMHKEIATACVFGEQFDNKDFKTFFYNNTYYHISNPGPKAEIARGKIIKTKSEIPNTKGKCTKISMYDTGEICIIQELYDNKSHSLEMPANMWFTADGKPKDVRYCIEGLIYSEEEFKKIQKMYYDLRLHKVSEQEKIKVLRDAQCCLDTLERVHRSNSRKL